MQAGRGSQRKHEKVCVFSLFSRSLSLSGQRADLNVRRVNARRFPARVSQRVATLV